MKEIYVKEIKKGVYECVKDLKEATDVVLPVGTYNNLMRIHRQRSCQNRQLPPKQHSGYVVCSVNSINEPHSRVRKPIEKYGTWDVDKAKELKDEEKIKYLMARKAAVKDCKVECYMVDLQTPYESSLSIDDLHVIMLPELYEKILPLLGYENDVWPEESSNSRFNAEWKKDGKEYVLKRTVYRIQLVPRTGDKDLQWHVFVYATAVPNIPVNMQKK